MSTKKLVYKKVNKTIQSKTIGRSTILCPLCKTAPLQLSERHQVEIDYYPSCRKVWLNRGELVKLSNRPVQLLNTITNNISLTRVSHFEF
ncbi:zf-TFIIB domain-containing protein [Piscirickettsia salmonis]|uniref:TFIIB-type zinc ribbon-containing protein n=1 Tax=Piscirickettsia salmonis TaxID=1238 RepID=UPI0018C2538E